MRHSPPHQLAPSTLRDALEGPACACFDGWDPEKDPRPRCPHLLSADHPLTLQKWGALLLGLLPKEYAERPPPPTPSATLPGGPGRVAVMRQRQAAGQHLYHPEDLTQTQIDRIGITVTRARNGHIVRGNLSSQRSVPLTTARETSLEARADRWADRRNARRARILQIRQRHRLVRAPAAAA